jgi:hypothetical protein
MNFAIVALSSVALLMASISGAAARRATTTISIDDFCDVFTVTTKGRYVAATDDPNCATGLVGGIFTKVKGVGNAATLGGIFNNDTTTSWTVVFSAPFVTGGTWILYFTQDGVTENFFFEGSYTVVDAKGRHFKTGPSFTAGRHQDSN